MKKGFTLAEVLITLAIIGVVAALTIPSVIVRTQQQEFKTAAKKAYSVLSQAVQLTEVKDGYTFADEGYFIEALIKNMNVVKVEDGRIGYSLPNAAIAQAIGPSYGEGTIFYTADGMAYEVDYISSYSVRFKVDVNGDKGPSNLLEGTIKFASCNDENICDDDNPEWPGYTLTDIFYISFDDYGSRIYFRPPVPI